MPFISFVKVQKKTEEKNVIVSSNQADLYFLSWNSLSPTLKSKNHAMGNTRPFTT